MMTTIVLVNYKNDADTVECVESLTFLTKSEFSVVIVDNGGTHTLSDRLRASAVVSGFFDVISVFDGGESLVTMPSGRVRSIAVVDNVQNDGFSAANNVGARIARDLFRSDYFWFLNNDTVVDAGALQALSDTVGSRIKAVGSKICFYHDRATVQTLGGGNWFLVPHHPACGKKDSPRFRTRRHFGFLDGCSFFVEASVFFSVGSWDETFFMYGEDVDLSERIKRAGYHLAFCAESRVFHKGGGSLDRRQRLVFLGPFGVMRFDFNSYLKNVIPETRNRRYLTKKIRGWGGLAVYYLASPVLYFLASACVVLFDDRKVDRCVALARAYWGGQDR
jgi:GT2 family glycosyltransferase